jgi:uncharacterized protein YicC (UPF0701 family)
MTNADEVAAASIAMLTDLLARLAAARAKLEEGQALVIAALTEIAAIERETAKIQRRGDVVAAAFRELTLQQ